MNLFPAVLGVGGQGFKVNKAPDHCASQGLWTAQAHVPRGQPDAQEGRAGSPGAQSHQLQPAASTPKQEGGTASLFTGQSVDGLPSILTILLPALEGQRALDSLSRPTRARKRSQGSYAACLATGLCPQGHFGARNTSPRFLRNRHS